MKHFKIYIFLLSAAYFSPAAGMQSIALVDEDKTPHSLETTRNLDNFKCKVDYSLDLKNHTAYVLGVSEDGTKLIYPTQDATIEVIDLQENKYLGRCSPMDVEGRSLWEVVTFTAPKVNNIGHSRLINDACFTKDGKIIISCSNDESIIFWDSSSFKSIKSWDFQDNQRQVGMRFNRHYAICLTPDGKKLIAGGQTLGLDMWNIEKIGSLEGGITKFYFEKGALDYDSKTNYVTSVAVTPDGSKVIAGSVDGFIRIWDIHTKELLITRKVGTCVNDLCVSHDGNKIFAACFDKGQIWIYEIPTMKLTSINAGEYLRSIAITTDGSKFVTYAGGKIQIYNVSDNSLVAEHKIEGDGAITTHGNKIIIAAVTHLWVLI
jgi:WD40 repeat protein